MTEITSTLPVTLDEFGPGVRELLAAGDRLMRAAGSDQLGPEHLLAAMLATPDLIPLEGLRRLRFDPVVVFTRLTELSQRRTVADR